jgi:pimeloyl-ACP methyl ester carboxylesterase
MSSIYSIAKKHIWKQFAKSGFENTILATEDYQIQYWDNKADKKILLLIHGFGAQAEFQWYKQIADFSKDYRVIIPNLLYFGDTKPLQTEAFTLAAQVQVIETLVQQLSISSFALMGISYGGLVSIEYANQYSTKVNKLVIVNAPIKYFNQKNINAICAKYELQHINELFAPTSYIGLIKQFKAAYYQKKWIPTFVYKSLYQKLCLPHISNWEQLLNELSEQMDAYNQKEYNICCATALIWGVADDIIPVRVGEELHQHLPNSTLTIIKKAKHLPNIEQAKKFNKIVLDFLK